MQNVHPKPWYIYPKPWDVRSKSWYIYPKPWDVTFTVQKYNFFSYLAKVSLQCGEIFSESLLCFPHGKGVDHVVAGIAHGLLLQVDHNKFAHGQRLAGRAGKAYSGCGTDVKMFGKKAGEP